MNLSRFGTRNWESVAKRENTPADWLSTAQLQFEESIPDRREEPEFWFDEVAKLRKAIRKLSPVCRAAVRKWKLREQPLRRKEGLNYTTANRGLRELPVLMQRVRA